MLRLGERKKKKKRHAHCNYFHNHRWIALIYVVNSFVIKVEEERGEQQKDIRGEMRAQRRWEER